MSLGHGPRPHPAVRLVRGALVQFHFSRGLLGTGEHAADHHTMRAGGERLGDIAGVANAAVANDRNTGALERLGNARYRAHLRHADSGDDSRRADRAGPDSHFDGIRPSLTRSSAASAVTMLPPIT